MARTLKILAVDDSLTIRKLLELSLGKAGYSLELAVTGTEGVNRAKRSIPNLILLDYVLPDMKGTDVCAALAQDEKTKSVPIIIMSAKSEDVKGLFKSFPSVVEFVGKPFTPPEIKFHVSNVLAKFDTTPAAAPDAPQATAPAASASHFTFAQKEAAAKLIFSKLRDRFAKIPEWAKQAGTEPPALFFGKKILTPDLTEALLTSLSQLLRETEKSESPVEQPALLGSTSFMNLINVLKMLLPHGRSGVLQFEQNQHQTLMYVRRGELVMVTCNRPEEYTRQATVSLDAVLPPEIEQAEAEQRRTSKPVFATYAEMGRIPAGEAAEVLHTQGKRVLMDAIEAGPGTFKWMERMTLPAYVEAHGRPFVYEQLTLERLRKVDDWAQVDLQVNSLDLVFERCDNFSKRLLDFDLTDKERRVLTLVDKRNNLKQIIERTGLATFEVFHALFCMSQIGLLRKRGQVESVRRGEAERGPVLIVEPDVKGIQDPLAKMLGRRDKQRITLVNANEEPRLIERCIKERPVLVLLSTGMAGLELEKLAKDIRSTIEISDTPLAAIVEPGNITREKALAAAGFDAVLVKPFLMQEILRLMVA